MEKWAVKKKGGGLTGTEGFQSNHGTLAGKRVVRGEGIQQFNTQKNGTTGGAGQKTGGTQTWNWHSKTGALLLLGKGSWEYRTPD